MASLFYHAVIFHLILNTQFNGLLNQDLPLKSTTPFGAKITRADSTLEMAPPLYFLIWFLNPDQTTFCTI